MSNDGLIKVNLPMNSEDFKSGNGEGIWVRVDPDIEKLHNEKHKGNVYQGTLYNDSIYYPALKWGSVIIFTMRGENRPVAIYDGFLDNMEQISKEALVNIMKQINTYRFRG